MKCIKQCSLQVSSIVASLGFLLAFRYMVLSKNLAYTVRGMEVSRERRSFKCYRYIYMLYSLFNLLAIMFYRTYKRIDSTNSQNHGLNFSARHILTSEVSVSP